MSHRSRLLLVLPLLLVGLLAAGTGVHATTAVPGPLISNVTDTAFTLSWTSRVAEGLYGNSPDTVKVYAGSCGGSMAGRVAADTGNAFTHWITVSGLSPSTSYVYQITTTDDGNVYPTSGTCYGPVTTGPTINTSGAAPITVSGDVGDYCNTPTPPPEAGPATGAIVRVSLIRGNVTSATDTVAIPSGTYRVYSISVGAIRTQNNSSLFLPQSSDRIHVAYDGGDLDLGQVVATYTGSSSENLGTTCLIPLAGNLDNGGFEDDTPSPWRLPSQGSIVTASSGITPHSGTHELAIAATAAGQYAIQTAAVEPGAPTSSRAVSTRPRAVREASSLRGTMTPWQRWPASGARRRPTSGCARVRSSPSE